MQKQITDAAAAAAITKTALTKTVDLPTVQQLVTASVSTIFGTGSSVAGVSSLAAGGGIAVSASTGPVVITTVGIPRPLGGSRQISCALLAAIQNCIDWLDIPIDWTAVGTAVVRAQVEVRANGTTTVTPSIYNVTDATTVVTGVACSATATDYSGSNQKQTLVIPAPGSLARKLYRLRLTASDAVKGVFGLGYIELV